MRACKSIVLLCKLKVQYEEEISIAKWAFPWKSGHGLKKLILQWHHWSNVVVNISKFVESIWYLPKYWIFLRNSHIKWNDAAMQILYTNYWQNCFWSPKKLNGDTCSFVHLLLTYGTNFRYHYQLFEYIIKNNIFCFIQTSISWCNVSYRNYYFFPIHQLHVWHY